MNIRESRIVEEFNLTCPKLVGGTFSMNFGYELPWAASGFCEYIFRVIGLSDPFGVFYGVLK